MKSKLQKQQLICRNEELELEQQKFERVIVDLQAEIQHLKYQCAYGSIDVTTENLLLRAEIRRHRAFLIHLKLIIDSVPELSTEEKLQLASSGIESAVGQVLGMCYLSATDKSWKVVSYIHRISDPDLPNLKIVYRYQYLPLGSTPETATRLNIRQDIYNVPLDSELIRDLLSGNLAVSVEKEFVDMHQRTTGKKEVYFQMAELNFAKLTKDDYHKSCNEGESLNSPLKLSCAEKARVPQMKVFRYRENYYQQHHQPPLEYLIMKGYKSNLSVNKVGFPTQEQALNFMTPTGETETNTESMKATVVAITQAPEKLSPLLYSKSAGYEQYEQHTLDGWVLRKSENGKGTDLTGACSFPLKTNEQRVPLALRKKWEFRESMTKLFATEFHSEEPMPEIFEMGTKMIKHMYGILKHS